MSQLTVDEQIQAFPGTFSPLVPRGMDILANEGSASVPVGSLVVRGSSEDLAILPVDGTGVVEGIVTHSHLYSQSEIDDVGLVTGASMDVMRRGLVTILLEDTIAVGGTLRVRRPAPAWQGTTVYALGDRVTNDGKLYECDGAGTSAASPGPVHTSGSAADGTASWLFLNFGTSSGQIGAFRAGAITDETVPLIGVEILDSVSAGAVGWVKFSQLAFGAPD